MTDQQLELELRVWFRTEVPATLSAPGVLRASVLSVPASAARPATGLRLRASRRRLVLLAAAALLVVGLIGSQLLGWGTPPPTQSLPPSSLPTTLSPRSASWVQAASMLEPRSGDGYGVTTWAVLLADGRVLVAGGVSDNRFGDSVLASAEIYDPSANRWTAMAPMSTPRTGHTMTLLRDGRVLAVGGTTGQPAARLSSAELFDPSSGTWTATGSLNAARGYHTATLLADGRVLVAGGNPNLVCNGDRCESDDGGTAEIYDPATGQWATTEPMVEQWVNMTAALLADGRVLVEGGGRLIGLQSAEIFDPATGHWRPTSNMIAGRNHDAAVLLRDGRVFVVGGHVKLHMTDADMPAEIYDPDAATWVATPAYPSRIGFAPATLLADGRVLVFGPDGFLLYDPVANGWKLAGSVVPRSGEMLVRLADGRVLVAGGDGDGAVADALTSVLIYDPGMAP